MHDFEVSRRQVFERAARQALEKLDPATGMIPGPKTAAHATGAHSRPHGCDLRATTFAMTGLAMTGSYEPAWKALAAVLDHQDTNPQSFTYGNFFWYSGWETALDPNAVSFIVPHLCYVLRHCENQLPVQLRERLKTALALALTGLNAHRATWGYTNIVLLNMASKLLIGDVLQDPRALKLVCWDWEEWRNHTVRLGAITEYNSLCYTAVQIEALAMMLTCRVDAQLLDQVRGTMRHLIAAAVLDYHPRIGRITGPQSRAYEKDRRASGGSLMDTILHFVLNTPEPRDGCMIWLGAPIGPDDVLSCARDLPLPRITRCISHEFARINYLAPDFALGHVSGRGHWSGHTVPFFLAYRSESDQCAVPFMPLAGGEGHFATQQEGRLLAATQWLIDRAGRDESVRDLSFGTLSGLVTGQPHNVVSQANFRPGFNVELGLRGQIRMVDGQGQVVAPENQAIRGSILAVEAESICFAVRFLGAGGEEPELTLVVEPDNEIVLQVRSTPSGHVLNDLEEACICAFYLDVRSRTAVKNAAEMAALISRAQIAGTINKDDCSLTVKEAESAPLTLSFSVQPAWMYSVNDVAITANQWARGLTTETSF